MLIWTNFDSFATYLRRLLPKFHFPIEVPRPVTSFRVAVFV